MVRLVLIPPLGHDQKFYDPLKAELSGRDVLSLDYPYFDKNFPWESHDLIEALAQYFAQKISGYEKVSILGVSLGATLSLRIKEILREKVGHLFLVSSGGHKVASFRKEMILTHLKEQGAETFLLHALEVGSQKNFEESDFQEHFHQSDREARVYWEHYRKTLWSRDHQKVAQIPLVNLVKASVEVNFESLLTQFQDEITIIWGAKDKVFSMRFYEKFKKLCPRSEFHLNEVGHFSPLETPRAIKDILLAHEKTS